jgi:hypothetical protein
MFWTPASAGVTIQMTFYETIKVILENSSFPNSEYGNIPPSAGQARKEKRNPEP